MGEEPGWRGYALPRLFSAMSPLPAAAVLGLIVAAWHLPLVLMGMLSFFGLPATFGITFVYCWLFNRTGGSVLLTLVFHATEGAIRTDQLGLTEDNLTRQSSLYALCWCVVAVAVSHGLRLEMSCHQTSFDGVLPQLLLQAFSSPMQP